ncbi:gamma-glutamylcyclotransferase (plasmid) [Ralstonia syzygii]|uniref:Gamma-glutamylcyclotransferase n=1 Tax=Ralstonia syzygii TaxID=28097 RepID=A0ABX7ZNJ6_9RALS|nr:gamma-glutamylcyclotransferase family protein [Ralstonia syzygii]QUP56933.1 gamma-glutamylcyclotransferase [Ralstonia syzygii]
MSQIYYFAYGSNMSRSRLTERLSRYGEGLLERRPGVLDGYRLAFNKVSSQHDWVGFANIVPMVGARVEGTLNAMHPRALDALDAIELVPHHYRRASVLVTDAATGALVPAFTYVANPDMVRPNLKPTRDYLAHLLAADDVLPVTYLDDVRAVECWA